MAVLVFHVYAVHISHLQSLLFCGVVTCDVIEKLNVVSDYAVSNEGSGNEPAVANLKILNLSLPGGGTE
jgi:hypothetical protein